MEKDKTKEILRQISSEELLTIPLTAKIVLRTDIDKKIPGHQSILIGGMVVAPGDIAGSDKDQMWECDIVIIPRRKFEGFKHPGAKLEDVLTNGFEKRENWDRELPV